jgi:hypothetical protein
MWHSCGKVRLADHFAGKPADLKRTFDRLVAVARSCGPVTVYAQKSRIVIQARVRFASAVVRSSWLDTGLWFRRRATHPRLHRTESLGRAGFGLHFKLASSADIDEELVALIREAYLTAIQDPRQRTHASG